MLKYLCVPTYSYYFFACKITGRSTALKSLSKIRMEISSLRDAAENNLRRINKKYHIRQLPKNNIPKSKGQPFSLAPTVIEGL